MTIATYHNHSKWSDGKATTPEIIASAAKQGIQELGISDHWLRHPFAGQQSWAMETERLSDYVNEILSLRSEAKSQAGIGLRLGLEVDWFPDHGLPLRTELRKFPFDYLIGSVHEVSVPDFGPRGGHGRFVIDMSPEAWKKITPDERNAMHRQYWLTMKTLAQGGVFDIVAHMDLPKKFGYYATVDLSREIGDALDAIAAAKTDSGGRLVVEVNTAGWHKPCADAYPTLDILKQCRRREIPVTINADAHQPEHLLRDFDKARARLIDAGYTQIARFAQRETRFEPLA